MNIELSNSNKILIIDDEDFNLICGYSVYLNCSGYAQINTLQGTVMVHRLVLKYFGN